MITKCKKKKSDALTIEKEFRPTCWHEGISREYAGLIVQRCEMKFYSKYYWPKGKSFIVIDTSTIPNHFYVISTNYYKSIAKEIKN